MVFQRGGFYRLTPKEQWDLHNFYLVTQEATDLELRLHRHVIKKTDPSLPQRAGRAYAKLRKGEWEPSVYVTASNGRGITVSSVVKPKPDLQKLFRAVISMQLERNGAGKN